MEKNAFDSPTCLVRLSTNQSDSSDSSPPSSDRWARYRRQDQTNQPSLIGLLTLLTGVAARSRGGRRGHHGDGGDHGHWGVGHHLPGLLRRPGGGVQAPLLSPSWPAAPFRLQVSDQIQWSQSTSIAVILYTQIIYRSSCPKSWNVIFHYDNPTSVWQPMSCAASRQLSTIGSLLLINRPTVDLIGAMETQSEPSELELDDVVITNPHIEAILENEDWIEDASWVSITTPLKAVWPKKTHIFFLLVLSANTRTSKVLFCRTIVVGFWL